MRWTRSDRSGEGRELREEASATADRLTSPDASRQRVSGRSPGSRVDQLSSRPHLPVPMAQWYIAVSGSLTVAWAAPALHSFAECAPASRFTPGTRSPGHLRRSRFYAHEAARSKFRAPEACHPGGRIGSTVGIGLRKCAARVGKYRRALGQTFSPTCRRRLALVVGCSACRR